MAAHLTKILDLLFSAKGLGLNIVRYNIGGGAHPNTTRRFRTLRHKRYRLMPGFKDGPKEPYCWGRDARQRAVLLGAKKRGARTFMAMAYSPPWWMTISGDVSGRWKANLTNLHRDYFGAFAQYLVDVVAKYKAWGVRFQYLEPVNEALEGWWGMGGSQEGCSFSAQDISRLYPILNAALKRKGLFPATTLVGFDSWADSTSAALAMPNQAATRIIQGIHVHGYYSPDKKDPRAPIVNGLSSVRYLAESFKKEVCEQVCVFRPCICSVLACHAQGTLPSFVL